MKSSANITSPKCTFADYSISNTGKVNIIMGKNGCGKSQLLREFSRLNPGNSYYLNPERGGVIEYNAGIANQVRRRPNEVAAQRLQNQYPEYRNLANEHYDQLERSTLRARDRGDSDQTFEIIINTLNQLLTNIELEQAESGSAGFLVRKKDTRAIIPVERISSGEAELLTLGIEFLWAADRFSNKEDFWLIIDEPDVHIHPDQQHKLMSLVKQVVDDNDFLHVLIATHSTAVLSIVCEMDEARVCFMRHEMNKLAFKRISESYRKVLPIFGAHPLTQVFNETPILLVEGEDDVRVWQQAVRTSQGKVRFYPCEVESIKKMEEFEISADEILCSVYDEAIGYSVRDGDDKIGHSLNDKGRIKRFRLNCYSIENLLLTDEVLNSLGVTWTELEARVNKWIEDNPNHSHAQTMQYFAVTFERKDFKLKDIRNDLMGIIGSNKPWEVAIGACIGKLAKENQEHAEGNDTIKQYLGSELSNLVFGGQGDGKYIDSDLRTKPT